MSYIGNEPIVSATRTITEITATAGQTVFVANGGYTVGYIDVFVNGAQLQTSDFTASNGSSITLTEAAQSGDVIRLVAWGTATVANTYTQAVADSRFVNATGDAMTGTLSVIDYDSRGIISNDWAEMSGGAGGAGLFGTNLHQFYDGVNPPVFRQSNTHGTIAGGGVAVNYPAWNSHSLVGVNQVGATANATVTPTTALIWDNVGRVRTPNQPIFSGGRNAGNSQNTTCVMNVVNLNRGNHYNTSTGVFTCPVAGAYAVSFSVMSNGNFSGAEDFFSITVNGAYIRNHYQSSNGQIHQRCDGFVIVNCAANDTISFTARNVLIYGGSETHTYGTIQLLG